MDAPIKTIRVFISSPGDVADERTCAVKVIERLNRDYAGSLVIKPVLWENLPLGADASFQEGIDMMLGEDRYGIDVAVFILWSRLGSPVGPRILKKNGSEYQSGTEREFHLMLEARKQSGGKRPHILAYIRKDEDGFYQRHKGQPDKTIREMLDQRELVKSFIEETFQDTETRSNIGAFHFYAEPVTFASRLRVHLKDILDKIAPDMGVAFGSWEGSPYRGLEAFHAEHEHIFFGREEEVCEVLQRLHERAKDGCASVVIIGASGSGKSSLARAGVMPALFHAYVDSDVAQWRRAILSPSEIAGDLFMGLARIFAGESALPELRGDDESISDLALALRDNPQNAWDLRIKPTLRTIAECADVKVRLFVLVDQLEELFTCPGISSEDAERFLHVLFVLAKGGVWILSTIKSDFYRQSQEYPSLMGLKEGKGLFDLSSLDPGDIHRIIVAPASMAGLTFERNDRGETLDHLILNDAVATPEALPLLEYVLQELYEGRDASSKLTDARYNALGGVEGALGASAERAYQSLPHSARRALKDVLQELITINPEDDTPVRRRANLESLTATPEKRELTKALIERRLLISDKGEVIITHEALLRRWDRVVQWIADNREALRTRAWLTESARRWDAEDRDPSLLLGTGKFIDRAEIESVYEGNSLGETEKEFVWRSVRRFRRRGIFEWIAIAVVDVLLLLSVYVYIASWFVPALIPDEVKGVSIGSNNLPLNLMLCILFFGWITWRKCRPLPSFQSVKTDLGIGLVCIVLFVVLGLTAETAETTLAEDILSCMLLALLGVIPIANTLWIAGNIRAWHRHGRKIAVLNPLRVYSKLRNMGMICCFVAFEGYVVMSSFIESYHLDDKEFLCSMSSELLRRGDLQGLAGNRDGALKLYWDSVNVLGMLREQPSANPVSVRQKQYLFDSLIKAGDALSTSSDSDTALTLRLYQESMQIARELVNADPGSLQRCMRLTNTAMSLVRVGSTLSAAGDKESALKLYQESLQMLRENEMTPVFQRLRQLNMPVFKQGKQDQFTLLGRIGDELISMGDKERALSACREGLQLAREWADAEPGDAQWRRDVVIAQLRMGVALNKGGSYKEAIDLYHDSLQDLRVARELAKTALVKTQGQRENLVDLFSLVDSLNANEKGDDGFLLKFYQEGLQMAREVSDADPSNMELKHDIFDILGRIAELNIMGNSGGAPDAYQERLDIARNLVTVNQDYVQWKLDLMVSLNEVASGLYDRGDRAGATTLYQEAIQIARVVATLAPENTDWKHNVLLIWNNTSHILNAVGDHDGAIVIYREGIQTARKLLNADPQNTELKHDLWEILNNAGEALNASGDLDGAFTVYRESLQIARGLLVVDPDNQQCKHDVEKGLGGMGYILSSSGKWKEALKMYEESLQIARELTKVDPNNDRWTRDLLSLLFLAGEATGAIGDREGALKVYQEGQQATRIALASDPSNISMCSWFVIYSLVLGDFADAVKVSEDAARLLKDSVSCSTLKNLAHAYLFCNRFEEAEVIYKKYKGSELPNGQKWNTQVLRDFTTFEEAGRSHPDMVKIRALLQTPVKEP